MKNKIQSVVLSLFLTIALNACKKGNEPTVTAKGTAAVVKAQNFGFDGLAGTPFTSNTAAIVKVGNLVTIGAIQDGTTNSIRIVLNNVTATGTFKLDKDNTSGNGAIISKDSNKPNDATINYSTDNSSGNMLGGGEVVITSLTSTDAEGTFYIVSYNSAGKSAFAEQGSFKGHIN